MASRSSLKKFEKQIALASSYQQWRVAALQHDELSGRERWKQVDQTRMYDHVAIRTRLDRLRKLRARKDDSGLLFALNEGIHGNMAGMGKIDLYSRAKVGTKTLITEYIEEIADALQYLAKLRSNKISFYEKLEFFRRASHCYGLSALMLSGGGALGHFHLGVLKTLVEHDLLPDVISGSSAGSVMAAVVGSHTNAEMQQFFNPKHLATEVKADAPWLKQLLWGKNHQIDVRELQLTIERVIPDLTFEEAFERTGRQINISVAPTELHQTSRLLNAITSPNVYLRSAVMASCAIPGVFPPVALQAKNERGDAQAYLPTRKWMDGSVTDDLPAKRLARLYGVNHYIVSQINPYVLWIERSHNAQNGIGAAVTQLSQKMTKEWLRGIGDFSRRYLRNSPRWNMFISTMNSMASQNYAGDINILPSFRFYDPRKILSPLSEKDLMFLIDEGERGTWPHIETIRNCTLISSTLHKILVDFEQKEEANLASASGGASGDADKTKAKIKPPRKARVKTKTSSKANVNSQTKTRSKAEPSTEPANASRASSGSSR